MRLRLLLLLLLLLRVRRVRRRLGQEEARSSVGLVFCWNITRQREHPLRSSSALWFVDEKKKRAMSKRGCGGCGGGGGGWGKRKAQ